MHNLISFNQLHEWRNFECSVKQSQEELETINEYYECLIECREGQSLCKRICRRILA
jgi:hypothetical protein